MEQTTIASIPFRSDDTSLVKIPDLFVSFASQKPIINQNYLKAKAESEAWISKYFSFLINNEGRFADEG
jgi:hypothetical protein